MHFKRLPPDVAPTPTPGFWSWTKIFVIAFGLSPAPILIVMLAYFSSDWSKPDTPPLCPTSSSCTTGKSESQIRWSTLQCLSLPDFPSTSEFVRGPELNNFFLGDSVCQPPKYQPTGTYRTFEVPPPSFQLGETVVMETNCSVANATRVQKLLPPGRELTFNLCHHKNCTCSASIPSSGVLVRGEFKLYGEYIGFFDWTWRLRRCEVELVSEERPPLAEGQHLNITIALESLPTWPNVPAIAITWFALIVWVLIADVLAMVLLCLYCRHRDPHTQSNLVEIKL